MSFARKMRRFYLGQHQRGFATRQFDSFEEIIEPSPFNFITEGQCKLNQDGDDNVTDKVARKHGMIFVENHHKKGLKNMKIPAWSVKKIVLALILLGGFFCVAPYARLGYLNLHGYCSATGEYMTDRERIEILVQYALDEKILPGKYNDVADFLKKNPNCCEVSDATPNDGMYEVEFLDQITGRGTHHVQIKIPSESLRKKGAEYNGVPVDGGVSYIVSNCGNFWNY